VLRWSCSLRITCLSRAQASIAGQPYQPRAPPELLLAMASPRVRGAESISRMLALSRVSRVSLVCFVQTLVERAEIEVSKNK
jgi:hypothetical protein